ncbi:50S ribosomal protein L29 [Cardiobacterium valvarum]|uniref:Large ribosomal subunit protein uL29 n=1 Tax=Cardiobacterium valvarum F0432 TaxID=797473 RepID=G9ZCS0_9GAMM|nr:50S ribosomal protein L29 [Cardiobacterium valvarum]EHM55652.1 ribosomal protein L29 [Cardiobacterium valvarum F0432]
MLSLLRGKDTTGLREELIVLRQMQLKLIMQKASSNLDKQHQIRQVGRNIARVKTLLRQHNVKV